MTQPRLVLAALVAALPSFGASIPADLFEATGRDPYFQDKHGFAHLHPARDHAFREFHKEAGHGRIDPRHTEFFCYIYTFQRPGQAPVFLHSPWRQAEPVEAGPGIRRFRVHPPLPETEALQVYTLFHSHPTDARHGLGPSRMDIATASTFKNTDGSYRYLYLVNSAGKLIQFKARRDLDPGDHLALRRLPVLPRRSIDWFD